MHLLGILIAWINIILFKKIFVLRLTKKKNWKSELSWFADEPVIQIPPNHQTGRPALNFDHAVELGVCSKEADCDTFLSIFFNEESFTSMQVYFG